MAGFALIKGLEKGGLGTVLKGNLKKLTPKALTLEGQRLKQSVKKLTNKGVAMGMFDKPKKGDKKSSFLAAISKAGTEDKSESRKNLRESDRGFFKSKKTKRQQAFY